MREDLLELLEKEYPKGFILLCVTNDDQVRLSCRLEDVESHPLGGYIVVLQEIQKRLP